MRVVHVTTGLDVGGAEMVLLGLLRHTDRGVVRTEVVSLRSPGPIAERIEDLGVPVHSLGANSMPAMGRGLPRLVRLLRHSEPDVVQTWMYHGDLFGGTAAKLAGTPRVVWGLHAGTLPPGNLRPFARAGVRGMAVLSRLIPDRIVCCSDASRAVHHGVGYDSQKMVVIPNGFDLPDPPPEAQESLRHELGLAGDSLLVGRVGRWHPQKDYQTMLQAWRKVVREVPSANLVLVGAGLDESNPELRDLLETTGTTESVILLGPRHDIVRLNAAFDVAVSSSSYGEGLPIVLGEAMSVGTPVVTTDVADSKNLVETAGVTVPPRDVVALSAALASLLRLPAEQRRALGEEARERIAEHYSLDRMASSYNDLYAALARAA